MGTDERLVEIRDIVARIDERTRGLGERLDRSDSRLDKVEEKVTQLGQRQFWFLGGLAVIGLLLAALLKPALAAIIH